MKLSDTFIQWGGWVTAGAKVMIDIRKFSADRKKTREEEIRANVTAIVNPELLHEKLNKIISGQESMDAKVDVLSDRVARLEGIAEVSGGNGGAYIQQDRMQIARRRGE